MAYAHHNADCYNKECKDEHGNRTYVYKGPDSSIRLWADGDWRTFCIKCGFARQANKNKAVKKAAYIKRQPTLFD
jgi:hypothetical protein